MSPVTAPPQVILLVDDTDALRNLAETVLKRAGYRVVTASDGEDALQVARALTAPLGLLITDLTMPHMDGRALAGELRRLQPDLKILFMSGTEESINFILEADGRRTWWLSKPFVPDELVSMVGEILSQAGAGQS